MATPSSTLKKAAAAAEMRAMQCRERRRLLASSGTVTEHDVAKAKVALAGARERAELAAARLADHLLADHRLAADVQLVAGSPELSTLPDRDELRARARKFAIPDLFVAYFSLTGCLSMLDLDAFLYEVVPTLPRGELVILDQAVWELENL